MLVLNVLNFSVLYVTYAVYGIPKDSRIHVFPFDKIVISDLKFSYPFKTNFKILWGGYKLVSMATQKILLKYLQINILSVRFFWFCLMYCSVLVVCSFWSMCCSHFLSFLKEACSLNQMFWTVKEAYLLSQTELYKSHS